MHRVMCIKEILIQNMLYGHPFVVRNVGMLCAIIATGIRPICYEQATNSGLCAIVILWHSFDSIMGEDATVLTANYSINALSEVSEADLVCQVPRPDL
jgi:hypothetical protein